MQLEAKIEIHQVNIKVQLAHKTIEIHFLT